jgi:hypothetical protein
MLIKKRKRKLNYKTSSRRARLTLDQVRNPGGSSSTSYAPQLPKRKNNLDENHNMKKNKRINI